MIRVTTKLAHESDPIIRPDHPDQLKIIEFGTYQLYLNIRCVID